MCCFFIVVAVLSVSLILFPIPFFANPNILLVFLTTSKHNTDVFREASITAPQHCSRVVSASREAIISPWVSCCRYLRRGSWLLRHYDSWCLPSSHLHVDSKLRKFYSCPFPERIWVCCVIAIRNSTINLPSARKASNRCCSSLLIFSCGTYACENRPPRSRGLISLRLFGKRCWTSFVNSLQVFQADLLSPYRGTCGAPFPLAEAACFFP